MMKHEDAVGSLIAEGFSLIHATEFRLNREIVCDTVGVYGILIEKATPCLHAAGFQFSHPMWCVQCFEHVYTGETFGLRGRLSHHLFGTIRDSNFRESLLAIQVASHALWQHDDQCEWPEVLEERLTDWLNARTMIAYKTCSFVKDVEADILARAPSPLNIQRDHGGPNAIHLRRLRSAFRRCHGELSGKGLRRPDSAQRIGSPA